MSLPISHLSQFDPEIAVLMQQELYRQQSKIELIASENFTSIPVMEAQGTWLTNKYAEGLPSKRYYGGCEYVDGIEQLAIDRVKQLFGAQHANVQPHSGAQANMAVFFAFLNPGDTILGMNLAHGGHLTHGASVSISGTYYRSIQYGVRQDGWIDYDAIEALATVNKPKLIIAGASAYPRVIDFERIAAIAKEVGAIFFVDMAHIAGLVATGLHPSPLDVADVVTTTTHKTLRGPRGGVILCKQEHQKAIDKAVFPGLQGGPLMHVIAAKAVAFKEALLPDFAVYQRQVLANAKQLATTLIQRGYDLVSGGTDNHLLLVDLTSKGLTGKKAENCLDAVGITVNKNAIPFDTQSPFVTSGIRIGSPAMTSRGLVASDMEEVAQCIADCLDNPDNQDIQKDVSLKVKSITARFALYPSWQ